MKLLVDMNLSPSWIDRLARHEFVAITNNPDFGNPRGQRWSSPSVAHVRAQGPLSDVPVTIVARTIELLLEDIERGAPINRRTPERTSSCAAVTAHC